MRQGVYNATVVFALCCCALTAGVHAADTSQAEQATANKQLQTTDTDARMKDLAQRFAEDDAEPAERTPLAQAEAESDTSEDSAEEAGTKRTFLLRPGDTLDGESNADRPDSGAWLLQTLTALGIVIGLAMGIRYVYARLGGQIASHASPVVEVLSRTTVAPRSHVMLLRVGGRVLVVSDSSSGMRTLASLEDPEEVADILGAVSAAKPTSISRGFGQLLHRFTDDHDKQGTDLEGELDALAAPPEKARDSVAGLLSRVRSLGRQGGEA